MRARQVRMPRGAPSTGCLPTGALAPSPRLSLTSVGGSSFGGSSLFTSVRDMLVKAFVRTEEGRAGAVYASFWTTLVRGRALDTENLELLSPA